MTSIITDALIQQLQTEGFAHIPNVIGQRELEGLQQAVAETVSSRPKPFYRTPFDFEHGGRAQDGTAINGDVLYRVKYSLDKHRRFLALLGNPLILSVASAIIKKPFIVCWEDLMVKEAGEPFGVPWHQDMESGGEGVYTFGVYIVDAGDNPLRVIPGSHKLGILPPEELVKAVGERASEVIDLRASAGDLVIHNLNIFHESGPCGAQSRYTLFFEFRSVCMVQAMPNWESEFVKARRSFIAAGVRARSSFADLVREDEERALHCSPFREFWNSVEELPPESEINFRVSQSRDRWCVAPTAEHQRRAVETFVADRDIRAVAARFGVSEEALYKWLCEAGVVQPGADGRYLERPRPGE
jgi:ectoine hydroxylase-related dioxygenase (phytanoyl-CoA dioxygenase family)